MQDVFKIEHFWKNLPRTYRNEPVLLQNYIDCLLKLEQHDPVEKIIRDSIKHNWQPSLVVLYGKTQRVKPDTQLATAGKDGILRFWDLKSATETGIMENR